MTFKNQNMGLPYERTDLYRHLCCTGHRTASAPDLYVLEKTIQNALYGSPVNIQPGSTLLP